MQSLRGEKCLLSPKLGQRRNHDSTKCSCGPAPWRLDCPLSDPAARVLRHRPKVHFKLFTLDHWLVRGELGGVCQKLTGGRCGSTDTIVRSGLIRMRHRRQTSSQRHAAQVCDDRSLSCRPDPGNGSTGRHASTRLAQSARLRFE